MRNISTVHIILLPIKEIVWKQTPSICTTKSVYLFSTKHAQIRIFVDTDIVLRRFKSSHSLENRQKLRLWFFRFLFGSIDF